MKIEAQKYNNGVEELVLICETPEEAVQMMLVRKDHKHIGYDVELKNYSTFTVTMPSSFANVKPENE